MKRLRLNGQPDPGGAEAGGGWDGGAGPVPRARDQLGDVPQVKWRSKFGGMDVSSMARMKQLEEENRRLKKLYIEAQIKADIVPKALAKKL
jgi:putative transposase